MALLQKFYEAPNYGLVIAVTIDDRLRSIQLIEIYRNTTPDSRLNLPSKNQHLTKTRIQYKFPDGLHIEGSLACEPPDEAGGGVRIRAILHYGLGSEQNYANLNDVIMSFDAAGKRELPVEGNFILPKGEQAVDPATATAVASPEKKSTEMPIKSWAKTPEPAEGGLENLFPYVYLRKWPQASTAVVALAYVQFPAAGAGAVFYAALTAQPGLTREQMQSEALLFCSGSGPKYAGLFVPDCAQLPGVIQRLPTLASAINAPGATPAELLLAIPPLLYLTQSTMVAALTSPDYLDNIERIWQSYFAQLILADGDPDLLADYTHLLRIDNIMRALFAPPTPTAPMTVSDLGTLCGASILLPTALFPLPPVTALGATAKGPINACAIGELHMVRHALVRYEAGELAHVENIMPGERREIRRTRAQGQYTADDEASSSDVALEQRADEARNSLVKQAQEAIAEQVVMHKYTDFDTTYGPPTQAKLNGSWTEWTKQGTNPGSSEQTEFARDILEQSVSRVTRNVSQARARGSYAHTEDSVTSTIDNSAGQNKLLCAFRWLNKVYSARVVGHGYRLMVEIILTQPAAGLRRRDLVGDACESEMPVSLAKNGVCSFAQITPDNYATLAAAYQVTNLMPAPASCKYLSATLCNAERKSLAVPPGYCVTQAFLTYVAEQPDADSPIILIGREKFKPGDDPAQVRTFGEDHSIALCVLAYAKTNASVAATPAVPSPAATTVPVATPSAGVTPGTGVTPSPGAAPNDDPALAPVPVPVEAPGAPMVLLANVVIACQPGATLLDEWRIKTYEALLRGYQHQLERARDGVRLAPPNTRKHIRSQLRQGCVRMLLARATALAGPAKEDAESRCGDSVIDPWQMQFIDELFEWSQMSTRLYAASTDAGMQELDSLDERAFAEFLEADMARVLLPVTPSHEAALLYFLSSGLRWEGDPALAPVDGVNKSLMLELKRVRALQRNAPVGAAWEIVVPTTMQVQDEHFSAASAPIGEQA